ncbi:T9SS type A sorting domain-containing protein [Rhodocaloribacter litoris]|uniref:beta strand repeat-containing protein n=1 Tax=Rhodocaloribacter litoris TaxID=2558931 RepID=UPI00141DCC7C|nr:FlgD immunoglobulin-like domain containing protein [Rhodocaloribacter litoris]QXD16700.1 T9SS type A sorting domain-containing protein [Rhodocaloribacter litoris]
MSTLQRLPAALLAVFAFLLVGAGGARAQVTVSGGEGTINGTYTTVDAAITAINGVGSNGAQSIVVAINPGSFTITQALTNKEDNITFVAESGSVTLNSLNLNAGTVNFGDGTDASTFVLNSLGLTIESPSAMAVTVAAQASVTIGSGSIFSNGVTLTVNDGGTLSLAANLTVNGTLAVDPDGGDSGTTPAVVDLGGNTLTVANGATLTNDGLIQNGTVATASGSTATSSTFNGSGTFPNLTIGSNHTAAFGATTPTVSGSLTVTGVLSGTGTVTLSGANTTHTVSGDVDPSLQISASGVTINGDTGSSVASELGNVTVASNASATIQSVKTIAGDVTVASQASLQASLGGSSPTITGNVTVNQNASLSLGNATVSGNVTVNAISLQPSSMLLTGNVTVNGTFTVVDFATLDIGTHTLTLGDDITVATNAAVAGTGTFKLTGSTAGHNFNGKSIANLSVAAAATINSNVTVTGSLTVDDGDTTSGEGLFTIAGGNTVTASGTVTLKDDFAAATGTLKVGGTMVQAPFDSNAGFTTVQLPAVTIDAAAGVMLTSSGPSSGTFQVQGTFTHTQGEVSLGSNHLEFQGNYTYTAGSYVANGGNVIWNSAGTFSTGGGTVSFPNLTVSQALTAGNDDSIEIRNTLVANAAISVDGDSDDSGDVIILDGASVTYGVDQALGTDADDVVLGSDLNVTYTGAATTNVELPASVATLTAQAALTVDQNVTVNSKLTADGAAISVSNGGATVTLTVASGGTIERANNGSFSETSDDKIAVTDYHLVYSDDVGTAYVAGGELKTSANILSLTVKDTNTGVAGTPTLDLPDANVTVGDLILDNGEVYITTTSASRTLTVTGNATVIGVGNVEAGAGNPGTLAFAGSSAQTFTVPSAGMTFASGSPDPVHLQVNNAAGVMVSGGNLTINDNDVNTIILTKGLLQTGSTNWIAPAFDSATDAALVDVSSGKGAIRGNVRLPLEDAGSEDTNAEAYVLTFGALGTYDADADVAHLRPAVFTFQNDETLQASGVQHLFAGYFDGDPAGSNGFPLMDGSLVINRYPSFYWLVRSSGTLPSNVVYDLRFEAEGYNEFVAEDVNNTRLIRRFDGSTANPWALITGTAGYNNFNASPSNDHPVVRVGGVSGAVETTTQRFTFGLETNLVAEQPDAVELNAGMTANVTLTPDVFMGGSPFLTPPPSYTYVVSTSNADAATATTSGDTLVVTAVAAGAATITITATDRLGVSTSTTLDVTVNADLVAQGTIANRGVNLNQTVQVAPLGTYFTGGKAPYAFSAASNDTTVATVAVSNDTLTVTGVGTGTAEVTVTATDALGDTATQAFSVTVNTGLVAVDSLGTITLIVGEDSTATLSGLFAGGTPPVTFAAASSDEAVATAAVSGDTLTVTAVAAGMATITVTATDSLGVQAGFSFEVAVGLSQGDVNGDASFDVADVVLVLQAIVGQVTLTDVQQAAADFNGDGEVDVADVVLMLQALAGGSGKTTAVRLSDVAGEAAWGEVTFENGVAIVPVALKAAQNVHGIELEIPVPQEVEFEAIQASLPEGWMVAHHFDAEARVLRVAMAGLQPAADEVVRLHFRAQGDVKTVNGLQGTVRLNAKTTAELAPVALVEVPEVYALETSYPNPFRSHTNIKYQLPEEVHVRLVVYDIQGREVARLVDSAQKPGYHTVIWDGRTDAGTPAASGLYLYRLEAGSFSAVRKMMLVR